MSTRPLPEICAAILLSLHCGCVVRDQNAAPPPPPPATAAPPPVTSAPAATAPTATSAPAPAPAASAPAPSACKAGSWRTLDEGPFSFSAPCELEKKPVQGIDSRVGRYEGAGMVLTFDHGWYSSNLSEFDKATNLGSEQASIGGKSARVITFKAPDASAPRAFWAAVHFPDAGAGPGAMKVKLTMLVEGKKAEDQATAKRIFQSIRFK